MFEKKYRYTNVELLDRIRNAQDEVTVKEAKKEWESRALSAEDIEKIEHDYHKFKEYEAARKVKNITFSEGLMFFFAPFYTNKVKMLYKKSEDQDAMEQLQYERYDKKIKQASNIRFLGYVFYFLLIVINLYFAGVFGQ